MVSRSPIFRITLFLLVAAMPVALFGANEVGKARGGGNAIQWSTDVQGHAKILLRVSDPLGNVSEFSFPAGKPLGLNLKDLGNAIDGSYTYEFLVVPHVAPGLAKALAEARANNDDALAEKLIKAAGLDQARTQTGGFVIDKGMFVDPEALESDANDSYTLSRQDSVGPEAGPATATPSKPGLTPITLDQVIPDDLIVQQSLCVGFDCVNNESFGFDTIRLKENNTRIKFDDTSSSAGYPANDWQITANDSASGGSNKWSVEDITGSKVPLTITAGASTNSIFVDSTGRVGFRTSTPVLDLHVNTSNTPAIRLEQNNSGGFTAQTWDIAGNEANFFVRDVTGGSRLPFRIRPGAPTSSIDINADGIVGIGTASPELVNGITQGMQIEAEFPALRITATGTGGHDYQFQTGNSGQLGISDVTGGTNNNRIFIAGTGNVGIGTTTTTSKLNVAGDVRTIGGAFIDDGTTLNAPDYVFDETYQLMPLAQVAEFIKAQKHLPNVPSAESIKANGLNMSQFQMRLLEKVEELTLYTINQHEQITSLKEQNQKLMERLTALEETKNQ